MNDVVVRMRDTAVAELQRICRDARVFVSMPWLEGITPRVLKSAESEGYPTSEALDRRHGIFRIDEIGLPVFDHGLLYGDAVFEGVLITRGRLFLWREHLDRLHQGAARMAIPMPYDAVDLTEHLLRSVRATGTTAADAAYIRFVMTRGLGDLGIHPGSCVGSTIYSIAAKIQLYPEAAYQRGLPISVAREVRRISADVLDPSVKSCNYLNNIRALLETLASASLETMMLTRDGYVAEATADNLFLVVREDGWEHDASRVRVITPVTGYCLDGITRQLILRAARARGYRTIESATMLPGDWLGDAREGFLTGTGAGLMPVIAVDGQRVGDGTPGPVTQLLRADLIAALDDPRNGIAIHATRSEIEDYLADGIPSEKTA